MIDHPRYRPPLPVPTTSDMERTSVSGVPVFWQQGPEPLSAGLVFGVGRRDEDFVRGGITHLLEHVVMHEVASPTLECNASVGLSTTEFTITGRPERVADFVRTVCRALSDPPVHRLAVEAGVLQAEGCGPGPLSHALGERYGMRGAGIAALAEPALLAITGDQLRAWAATYFTAANAAVWFTGPVPDGLELPLPAGEPPSRPAAERVRIPLPAWSEHGFDEVVVAAELPIGVASACLVRLVRQRVEDELRHRRGLTYAVNLASERIDESRRHAGMVVEVRPSAVKDAVGAVMDVIARMATEGPTERELLDDLQGTEEWLADPRAVPDKVQSAAESHVRGWSHRSDDSWLADARALTCDDVRDRARLMRQSLLIGVPEDTELDLPGVSELPNSCPDEVTGRLFRRRLTSSAPRGARLIVGDDGAMVTFSDGRRWTVRWDDALGLVDDGDGMWMLVGANGWCVPLAPDDWRHGDEAMEVVRRRIPAELCVKGDPEPDEESASTTGKLAGSRTS